MTNPTANRAYDMPASTDLVTNLPADFAIFGDAVDLDVSSRGGYTTTATAAGTTTLTIASNRNQRFTGTTTQTVVMPVASTLAVGARWKIHNKSTGIVTVQSSGANTIYAIPAATTIDIVCILASGTSAASWDYDYAGGSAAPSSGSLTLLSTTTLSGALTTISSISGSYKNLQIEIVGVSNSTADGKLYIKPNASATISDGAGLRLINTISISFWDMQTYIGQTSSNWARANTANASLLRIYNYASATDYKNFDFTSGYLDTGGAQRTNNMVSGTLTTTSAISSITLENTGGNFAGGTVRIYGVN